METQKKALVGKFLLLVFFLITQFNYAQTIIMNEVSNGPSGNKEYVEFVVIDTAVTYNCGITAPPCIDIRSWIFDDNSGLHGAGGIAAGAIRFANKPLWSCVPLGTIILIYNDADPNPDIPAIDTSIADGNCRIVAPISSNLFESNLTTPGAVACSYPASGWTTGGNWSNTLMANTGDCARIVNLAGCEVFSVCWATCNLSTLIYFNSAGSGTDNVWYFNNGDPNDQVNWTEGCADLTACGINDQTPGLANNSANAAYIAQFNNGCAPITPISSSIVSSTDAGCNCTGTAIAQGSGSIPGYTYLWLDASFVPIGQTDSIATGLCAGTYYVIITSSIDCSDTSSVTISSTGIAPVVTVTPSTVSICNGQSLSIAASGADNYSWSPSIGISSTSGALVDASPNSTTTYSIIGTTSSGCSDTTILVITVNPVPNIGLVGDTICNGESINLNVSGSADSFSWSPSTGLSSVSGSSVTASPTVTTTYTVIAQNVTGCSDTVNATITVVNSTAVNINPAGPYCENAAPVILSASPVGGVWSGTGVNSAGIFNPSAAGFGLHDIIYTIGGSSVCSSSDTISIQIDELITASIDTVNSICVSSLPVILTASPSGGVWSGVGVSGTGSFSPSGTGNFNITYTVTNGACVDSDSQLITVEEEPVVNILVSGSTTFCQGDSVVLSASAGTAGTILWSNGETGNSITVTNSGNYFVTLSNDCSTDTSSIVSVTVNDISAAFTPDPSTGQSPLTVNLTNATSNADYYSWNINDSITVLNTDTTVVFELPGTYAVTLYVISAEGCTDSLTQTVLVFGEFNVVIPNVFTPNGDGQNDGFILLTSGVDQLEISIFNRWGQLISSDNFDELVDGRTEVWDGKYNGNDVVEGTYAFVLKAIGYNGEEKVQNGFLTLIRNN